MILTPDELTWIDERMKIYDIKYQEIYDEILDHIITAMEEKRKAGDQQDIKWLFQDVVDTHFNGYAGIESLAAGQERIYLKGVRKLWSQSFKYNLNWPILAITVVALLLSFYLPNIKVIRLVLMIACLLFAVSPMVYTQFALAGKFKTMKGKRSLLKSHLVTRSALPASLLNAIVYLPQIFFLSDDETDNWTILKHVSPPIIVAVLMLFLILNLTVMRFCREFIATNSLTS